MITFLHDYCSIRQQIGGECCIHLIQGGLLMLPWRLLL
jgi:hypothetical protein